MSLPSFDLDEVKARLLAKVVPIVPDFKVLKATDINFRTSFGTIPNCLYFLQEAFHSQSPGGTSGRVIRQTFNATLELAIVGQKYADGSSTQGAKFKVLKDAIFDGLIGWTPSGSWTAFDLQSSVDGDPADTVLYVAQKWHSTMIHQGVLSP